MEDNAFGNIVQSVSFQVEASPQDEVVQVKSVGDMTPVNVKIRVRKKDESGAQRGVITMPRFHPSPAIAHDRIRLASSDQTILSFNMLMEADGNKKLLHKPKRSIFKGCLGVENDDEGPYISSRSLLRTDNHLESTIANAIENQNGSVTRKERTFFGKCKPGGCLDPPFDEDKYPYEPIDPDKNCEKNTKPKPDPCNKDTKLKPDPCDKDTKSKPNPCDKDAKPTPKPCEKDKTPKPCDTKSKRKSLEKNKSNDNITKLKALGIKIPSVGEIEEEENNKSALRSTTVNRDSTSSLHEVDSNANSLNENDSNSIITYPTVLSHDKENIYNEKFDKKNCSNRNSNASKGKNSFNEENIPYFSPKREKGSKKSKPNKSKVVSRDSFRQQKNESLSSVDDNAEKVVNIRTTHKTDQVDQNSLEKDFDEKLDTLENIRTDNMIESHIIGEHIFKPLFSTSDDYLMISKNTEKPSFTDNPITNKRREYIASTSAVLLKESQESTVKPDDLSVNKNNIGVNNQISGMTESIPGGISLNIEEINGTAKSEINEVQKVNDRNKLKADSINILENFVSNPSSLDDNIKCADNKNFKYISSDSVLSPRSSKTSETLGLHQNSPIGTFEQNDKINKITTEKLKHYTKKHLRTDDSSIKSEHAQATLNENSDSFISEEQTGSSTVKKQMETFSIEEQTDDILDNIMEIIDGDRQNNIALSESPFVTENDQTIMQQKFSNDHKSDKSQKKTESVYTDNEKSQENTEKSHTGTKKYNELQKDKFIEHGDNVQHDNKSEENQENRQINNDSLKANTDYKEIRDKDNDTLVSSNFKLINDAVPSKVSFYSDEINLDLAFHSSFNENKERVIKSFNNADALQRKHDGLVIVKKRIKVDNEEVSVLIDSDNIMAIKIKKGSENEIRGLKQKSKLQDSLRGILVSEVDDEETNKLYNKILDRGASLHDALTFIYDHHLIPLYNVIEDLNKDIEYLALQQDLYKQKIEGSSRKKSPRYIAHTRSKRCVCIRK